MKYLPLLLKNLFRKKTRLLLTIGSFAVAMCLFGILAIVNHAFSAGLDVAGADRLVIVNRVSIIQPLPLAYLQRIEAVKGVTLVTYANWFGAYYKDPKNFFPQYAIDVDTYRKVFPEFIIPDDQWKTFVADREGAIVGADTAKRYGFKVGDRIPLMGVIWGNGNSWEFNIDGIYAGKRPDDDKSQFWLHWDYFDERRGAFSKGTAGWYTAKIDNPDNATAISATIDKMFANSSYETKTETEKAFAAGWIKQTGNIGLLMTIIGTVVFFTLLLVIGNTMAMTVRERFRELAVLKAIGYTDTFVLVLVLAEGMLIAIIGIAIGLFMVLLVQRMMEAGLGAIIPVSDLKLDAALEGLGLTLGVGLLAGLLPALNASRLRVVDALRRV